MNTLSLTKITFATLGLLFVVTAHPASAANQKSAANPYECLTDDGHGRKRPCSANFQQKRADKNPFDCVTDDGHGRKRPCSANVKR